MSDPRCREGPKLWVEVREVFLDPAQEECRAEHRKFNFRFQIFISFPFVRSPLRINAVSSCYDIQSPP
jgi:hypothetical protein